MPSHLKEHVRTRMEKTGESYEQALRHVRAQEARAPEGRVLVPTEHGSFVKLHQDGSMVVQAILRTDTAAVGMTMTVAKSG
jgi:hypothetical protein